MTAEAGAVILAAGAGRRLGGVAKATLRDRHGRTYLEAIVGAARNAGAAELVVVVAEPHRDETARAAGRLGVAVVDNPEPERGMASSIACGFAEALARFRAPVALLWPVDHPAVGAPTVREVLARAGADRVVVPCYRGRGGHPPAIGRALWPALAACADAAGGARTVLRAHDPIRLEVEDAGVVADVDTPADLA